MKNFVLFVIVIVNHVLSSSGQDLFPVRQLSFDPAQEGFATWSPDSKTVVYQYTDMQDTYQKNGLWEIPADGSAEPKHIFSGLAEHPKFSPDGKYIVFDADTGNSIKMISAMGGEAMRILPDSVLIQNGGLPCWSPDGSQIAFIERKDFSLCTYNLQTGELRSLFREQGKLPLPGGWWPDGKSILVSNMDRQSRKCTMLRINADGDGKTILSGHLDNFYRYMALSPDGSMLVYAVMEGKYLGLYVMPSEGGKSIPLAKSKGHNEGAIWSPDGTKIAFTSTRTGSFDIWIMDVNVGKLKKEMAIK